MSPCWDLLHNPAHDYEDLPFINGNCHHQISVSSPAKNPQNPQSFWAGGFFIFALGFTYLAGQHLR